MDRKVGGAGHGGKPPGGVTSRVAKGESKVTFLVRCQNCGFSFTVSYQSADISEGDATPVTCGHCRSSRWSAQPA